MHLAIEAKIADGLADLLAAEHTYELLAIEHRDDERKDDGRYGSERYIAKDPRAGEIELLIEKTEKIVEHRPSGMVGLCVGRWLGVRVGANEAEKNLYIAEGEFLAFYLLVGFVAFAGYQHYIAMHGHF